MTPDSRKRIAVADGFCFESRLRERGPGGHLE
jgi:hypothetical protein